MTQPIPEQVVSLGFGKAIFSSSSATFANLMVTPPFKRVSSVNSGRKSGAHRAIAVSDLPEVNGRLISSPIAHPDGVIILLQTQYTRGGMPTCDASLFLRLRSGAPLYMINARVPTAHENICGSSFLVFQGRADILNEDELRLLGVEIPRSYSSRFMQEEELTETYTILQMEPERIPRPSVSAIVTPDGIERREIPQLPNRRLVLRRR